MYADCISPAVPALLLGFVERLMISMCTQGMTILINDVHVYAGHNDINDIHVYAGHNVLTVLFSISLCSAAYWRGLLRCGRHVFAAKLGPERAGLCVFNLSGKGGPCFTCTCVRVCVCVCFQGC